MRVYNGKLNEVSLKEMLFSYGYFQIDVDYDINYWGML